MNQIALTDEGLPFSQVYNQINRLVPSQDFSLIETQLALERMSNDNKVMISDGTIYRI